MNSTTQEAVLRVRDSISAATSAMVGREYVAELMVLAAVAQEHLLIVGPPGTAKSAVVRRIAQALGGRYFEYLLGKFTEPNELFGPVDLRKLREGVVETDITGMLPEAEIVFLDEVFLGSTAILNTLLGILNERRFRRGHTRVHCPLRICVGAANDLPDDVSLAAFADRFLLHLFVAPVPDHQLETLLTLGWQADRQQIAHCADVAHLDTLSSAVDQIDLINIRGPLANAIRLLRKAGIDLSDRRIVKSQRLIAAAAVLAGRTHATESDLWPLIYIVPTESAQHSAREVLKDMLAKSSGPFLHAVVEELAQQPHARVPRLVDTARMLVQRGDQHADFQRDAENCLKEIDATFNAGSLPEDLAAARSQLIALLSSKK